MQMDFKRLILILVFGFSVFSLWTSWNQYQAKKNAPVAAQSVPGAQDSGVPAPMASGSAAAVPGTGAAVPAAAMPEDKIAGYKAAGKVVVTTDTMKVTVSAKGGDVIGVELLKHKQTDQQSGSFSAVWHKIIGDAPAFEEKNFVMFQSEGDHFYVARSGFAESGLPNHNTLFEVKPVTIVNGEQQLRLVAPTAADGITVTKVLTFPKDSYQIKVSYEVANAGSNPFKGTAYFELVRDDKPVDHKGGLFGGASTFTGPAFFTEQSRFQKVDFKKIAAGEDKHVTSANDGWVAMIQHFFVSAYLPDQKVGHREFFTRKISNDLFGAGVKLDMAVPAGKTVSLDVPLYVGPQEQKKLESVAPGFNLVVDYGWTQIIAQPLFWCLSWVYAVVGNWGWAILIVTLLIKLAFFPLSAASYRSMAKMKQIMPRMKQLQDRYKDDKVKLNQAMMELYKTEKVNPMGGCLPILVQMPVFMALYYVLQSVVEMRNAPWALWIHDLSSPDPYFALPLIMGATMLIQTKLNPAPADPMQAKVMMLMPIMFTVMFLFFPSGLVLYWVLNNILSIAQQWYITRMIENAQGKVAR